VTVGREVERNRDEEKKIHRKGGNRTPAKSGRKDRRSTMAATRKGVSYLEAKHRDQNKKECQKRYAHGHREFGQKARVEATIDREVKTTRPGGERGEAKKP